jgi:hypothetical protein
MIYDERQKAFLKKDAMNAMGGEHGRQQEEMDTAPVDRSGQGNAGGKCPGRLQDIKADWPWGREERLQKSS